MDSVLKFGSYPIITIFSERKVQNMICLNCGKTVDDDLRVCPYCGSLTEAYDSAPYYSDDTPDEAAPVNDTIPEADESSDFYDDDPVYPDSRKASKSGGKGVALPGGLNLATILAAVSCVLSLICLVSVLSLRGAIANQTKELAGGVSDLRSAVSAVNDRLSTLDSTLANVQSEAYNQLASQSIAITKDLTPLTGPVETGKYNRMFIIDAKGNLNVNTSFDWQKYNEATGGWVSIVFTGNATTNEQYGLRLENTKNDDVYESILWANGITAEASGTYRCVITDATGITKVSAEATVTVG